MTTPRSAAQHFHGFAEGDLEHLHAAIRELTIRGGRPSLLEVEDCAAAPLKYRGRKNSGAYDRENNLISSSARIRGTNRVEGELGGRDLRNAAKDRREAYYLGTGEKHFGHFLLEVLCRAWAWEEKGEGRVAVLQSAMPPFARALFALIPGLLQKVEIVRKPTRFARMTVPGASFVILCEAYLEFKRMCERMAARALKSVLPESTDRPLYLSRAGLDPSRRSLVGEIWLEQLLEKEGFVVVRPETLPIAEQIALMNRHKWIISPIGSAAHTRVFSRQANNFVTITPAFFNQNHILCDLLCEGSSHYVNALAKVDIGTDVGLESIEPLMLDGEKLLVALKQLGLVRPSAVSNAQKPDLDDYKRRWIAAARWLARAKSPSSEKLRNAIGDVTASMDAQRKSFSLFRR